MITSTRDQNPLINLVTIMGDGGIEAQEAQGQRQLVASQQLPANGDWEGLEKLGVKRGDPVEGDELFVNAELPEGWEKRSTDHSMWSEIVNEKGDKVASIFYKAAFYDRDAFIRLAEQWY